MIDWTTYESVGHQRAEGGGRAYRATRISRIFRKGVLILIQGSICKMCGRLLSFLLFAHEVEYAEHVKMFYVRHGKLYLCPKVCFLAHNYMTA